MSKWFNLLAWKAGVRQRTEGSNPSPSTINSVSFYSPALPCQVLILRRQSEL